MQIEIIEIIIVCGTAIIRDYNVGHPYWECHCLLYLRW